MNKWISEWIKRTYMFTKSHLTKLAVRHSHYWDLPTKRHSHNTTVMVRDARAIGLVMWLSALHCVICLVMWLWHLIYRYVFGTFRLSPNSAVISRSLRTFSKCWPIQSARKKAQFETTSRPTRHNVLYKMKRRQYLQRYCKQRRMSTAAMSTFTSKSKWPLHIEQPRS